MRDRFVAIRHHGLPRSPYRIKIRCLVDTKQGKGSGLINLVSRVSPFRSTKSCSAFRLVAIILFL